jgi:hypothetical protein
MNSKRPERQTKSCSERRGLTVGLSWLFPAAVAELGSFRATPRVSCK